MRRRGSAGGGWRGAAAVALVLGLLATVLVPAAGLTPAATARAASTDLTLVTSASYVVVPSRGRVHVTVDVTAANHVPDTRTTKYYFDHAFLAVQPGIASQTLTGAKGASVVVAKRAADSTLLRLNFGSRLYGGQVRTLRLAFDLVGTGAAARRLVRVGASLVTFPVWAFASDGASGSRVSVRFPAGYDVTVESGTFATQATASDGSTVLASGPLAAPLSFFAYVSGQQPATYAETPLSVPVAGDSIPLTIRAWKDDPAWGTRIAALFRKALPVLRTDIGLAWPHTTAVAVQEAVSRSADGYAGQFDPTAGRIEVAYWAAQPVAVHEAAHGWFNGTLLADRWADEGFAGLYAQRSLARLGIKAQPPALTPALKATAYPLNAWPATQAQDPADDAYGYTASYVLAAAIAARAGDDAMRRVWADAAGRIGAYQPPANAGAAATAPETVAGPPDWRGLLDLLETETGEDFSDLWRTWVVRPGELSLLDARAAARTAYTRTLAVADGWSLPRSIRDAMRAWRFDAATALMADARTVLAQRAALEEQAARAGLQLPSTTQVLFEAGSLAAASAEAEAERNALAAVATAEASRTADGDVLSLIGMIGERPEADMAAARAALAAGSLDVALASADSAYHAWTGAWQEGRRRALLALALLATVVVLGSAIGARARRARLRQAAA